MASRFTAFACYFPHVCQNLQKSTELLQLRMEVLSFNHNLNESPLVAKIYSLKIIQETFFFNCLLLFSETIPPVKSSHTKTTKIKRCKFCFSLWFLLLLSPFPQDGILLIFRASFRVFVSGAPLGFTWWWLSKNLDLNVLHLENGVVLEVLMHVNTHLAVGFKSHSIYLLQKHGGVCLLPAIFWFTAEAVSDV